MQVFLVAIMVCIFGMDSVFRFGVRSRRIFLDDVSLAMGLLIFRDPLLCVEQVDVVQSKCPSLGCQSTSPVSGLPHFAVAISW